MNGAPTGVRSRFDKAVRGNFSVYISSVVVFELWYGIAKSARIEVNTRRLELLLSSSIISLPFENEDARTAGSIRATLEAAGKEGRTVPVHLRARVTEIGTLELWSLSRDGKQRWKLEFNVRERVQQ